MLTALNKAGLNFFCFLQSVFDCSVTVMRKIEEANCAFKFCLISRLRLDIAPCLYDQDSQDERDCDEEQYDGALRSLP